MLQVVPSFSETFSGDILPEAVLLKNILEEMMTSLNHLSTLTYLLTAPLQSSPLNANSKMISDEKQQLRLDALKYEKMFLKVRILLSLYDILLSYDC